MMSKGRTLRWLSVTAFALCSGTVLAADVDATLKWARKVTLGVPVSGVVTEVAVADGERVREGQRLLSLDQRAIKARHAQAAAALQRAVRLMAEGEREMERAQELFDRTVLSEHELETAKIGRDQAEAQLRNAEAEMARAELDLAYSVISAPFAGVVVQRNVEIGQTVISELQAAPLLVLVETDVMLARAVVSMATLNKLQPGQQVAVDVAGKTYQGVVQRLGVEPVAGREAQYELDVRFDTGGRLLRAGAPAKLRLP